MKKFDWNEFSKGKIAVILNNENEWADFMKYAHERGVMWSSGRKLSDRGFSGYPEGVSQDKHGLVRSTEYYYGGEGYELIYWGEYMMEDFTKTDLKNGDVVENRQGARYIYFEEAGKFVNCRGYDAISNYRSDLLNRNYGCKSLDIMFVERDGKVMFHRKEKPRKVTMREVNEKFGEEVCIVED